MITITFEADGLIKKLEVMGNRAKNLRPFLKDVGEYLVKKSRKRFAEGGVPRWKENTWGNATLIRTGNLRNSVKILEQTDSSVTVGTESKQRFHNAGYSYRPTRGQRGFFFAWLKATGRYEKDFVSDTGQRGRFVNPARPFLKFDQEDYPFIANKLEQYIVKD